MFILTALAMQATRQQIIEFLKEKGQATVEELAATVHLTPMAVRHHLNVLQAENLITASSIRRQTGPGRPSQVYQLTEVADELFPQDYYGLTDYLLAELDRQLGKEGLTQIFSNIAQRLAREAPPPKPYQTFEERLDEVVTFLMEKGFVVDWEAKENSYMIHAYSCPYRQIVKDHGEICLLDKQIIGTMLNTVPTRIACLTTDDTHCTYQISRPIELILGPN
jgi:predicted ArsR family transcriptional regulator